jgi:hypothetical protein
MKQLLKSLPFVRPFAQLWKDLSSIPGLQMLTQRDFTGSRFSLKVGIPNRGA